MKFANPEMFYLLILLPLLALLFVRLNKSASKRMEKFASQMLLQRLIIGVDKKIILIKFSIFLAALAVLIVALARPQFGVEPRQVKRVGVDIMVLLDTSLSMAAEDIAPNRLTKAKKEIERLADRLEGNRMGLMLFAGESAVESPLTLDISTFKMFLNSITLNSIPVGGTDISGALKKGIGSFAASKARSKVILLITDGEDNEGNPVELAEEAAEQKVKIYTVGLGRETGVPIPVRDSNGKLMHYKKDINGETVLTKQNSKTLEDMARITGGLFVSSRGGLFDIEPVIESIQSLEKSNITSASLTMYIDRFQSLLGLALVLVFAEFFIVPKEKFISR